jgi:hybrid cluster-associated redox disulfide protein
MREARSHRYTRCLKIGGPLLWAASGERGIHVQRYTRDMVIRDVLCSHESAAAVFDRHGLACAVCLGAEMETLESVASMHDIPVDRLIEDLNALPGREGGDD